MHGVDMKSIKVLHTGDFHLGYDYGKYDVHSVERATENIETFFRVVDLCRDKDVDVMLIAGDLFDNDNPKDELIDSIIRGFQKIQDVIIMIAPGNHDYYRKGSYYDRISTLCENVFIFDGEMDFYEFHIKENTVRIYGAGFTDSIMRRTLMTQRMMFQDISVNLGVFHGEIGEEGPKAKYAPMSLKQIEENCFDYLALGHIHKQTKVMRAGRTNYAYCGCPEGLNYGTQGVKGVYLGEVGPGYADMEYIRTCKRMYIEEVIDIVDAGVDIQYSHNGDESKAVNLSVNAMADVVRDRLEWKYGDGYRENLYRIVLEGVAYQKTDIKQIEEELDDIYSVRISCEPEDGQAADSMCRDRSDRGSRNGDRCYFFINRIDIISFGGLKNFRMEFEDRFQVIYGENEFGKSTIMAFIKMMLYGCTSKSRDISQNLRKKYQPFDGSIMKGSMEFTVNNSHYIVEREFGKSKSFDVCRVFDIDSGSEISFPKEYEVGDYFLSISQEDFNKTIFAGDMLGVSEAGVRHSLSGGIVNLSGRTEECVDLSSELTELTKKMELLQSKRGTSGKIPEVNARIDEYRREISRLNEERDFLLQSGKVDEEGLKREKRVISSLINKMKKLEETADDREEKKLMHFSRQKGVLSFLMAVVMLGVITGAVLCKNKNSDIIIYAGGVIVFLVLCIKRVKVVRKIRQCVLFDVDLQKKIDVIMREFGYNDYSIGDLEERRKKIDEMLSSNKGMGNERINKRIEEYEIRITELIKKRNVYMKEYDALWGQTVQLKELIQQAGKSITGPVGERAARLFSCMSGKEYESFMVDEDCNIRVKKYGSAIYEDWHHLSTAAASQAYLSLRISLCEVLGGGNIVFPLLFDDIVSSYDEERARRTIGILRQLDTQVILFTCHRFLCDI